MADVKWKATWTTNFSFLKLKMGAFKAMNEFRDDLGESSVNSTKKAIDDGLRALRPATLEARKRGVYWGKETVAPTSDTTPLKYTGRLYKSIKWNKTQSALEMNHYGRHQDAGFTAGGVTIKKRPFIKQLSARTAKGREMRKRFFAKLNKSMKTSIKGI